MNATVTLFAINNDLVGEKLTPIFIDGKNEIALAVVGTATHYHSGGFWCVDCDVIYADGSRHDGHTMPDSFKEEWEAESLADSLNGKD